MFSRIRKSLLVWLLLPILLLISPSYVMEQDGFHQDEQLTPLQKSRLLFRTAYHYFQTGSYGEAITAFNQFTINYPENILLDYAHFYTGISLMKTARYKEALKTFEQLKTAYPESVLLADVEFLIADNYYFQGKYDTAIQRYLALTKDKRYKKHRLLPELYLKLGHCYEQKKHFTSARKIYHQARFTYISRSVYTLARDREAKLLGQHPSLRQKITVKEWLTDVDKLLKYGRARDAVRILTELSQKKLSIALQQKILLKHIQAHYMLRDNQRALEYCQQFLKKYPTSKTVPYVLDRIGRLHLRQQDMASFLKIYDRLRQKYPRSRYTAAAIRLKGKELELQGKYKEALTEYSRFMKSFPKNGLVSDILWNIGWVNYRLQHYNTALKTLDRLIRSYPKSYHKEEALYWAGKSAEQVQKYSQAGNYYLKLIRTNRNSYYGFLSRQALTRMQQKHPNLKLSQKPREIKPLNIANQPEYTKEQAILHREKAKELSQIRLYDQAAEELASAIGKDKPDEAKYLELAQFYLQAGNYHELSRLMRTHFWEWIAHGEERLPKRFWKLSYPLSFYDIIEHYASSGELDPLFVTSLMLAESMFDPEAYSPAGAMGLMQLMPATGARMAKSLNISAISPERYFRPEVNILLGMTYLKGLFTLFDHQFLPVIASYNAGEHVVSTWWNNEYKENLPVFVASIPYKETKRYVQKVLWYYREYQRIYQ